MSVSTSLSSIAQMPAFQALVQTAPVDKKHRVLIVDKPQFSSLIQQMLGARYSVLCIEDAVCALKHMMASPPDLVVVESAVRGGGINLVELMKMSPGLSNIPVIVTCLEPTDALVKRVKDAQIASLIAKPFRPSTLITQVEIELLRSDDESCDGESGVPACMQFLYHPSVKLGAFLAGKSDDDDGFYQMLQNDAESQSAILHLGNVAYSPKWRQIDSFKLAIGMMGIREAKIVALCVQVLRALRSQASRCCVNFTSIWKQAIGTAFIARSLGKKVGIDADQCFVAGLFHELGKVVLGSLFPEYYAEVRESMQNQNVCSVVAEKEILGMTHAHAGMLLATAWGAEDQVSGAVAWHHKPTLSGRYMRLASLLYVASAICNHLAYGSSGEVVEQDLASDALLGKVLWKLGLNPQTLDGLVDVAKEDLVRANAFLDALYQK